jgi:Fur family transcriptional regulator, ferric uptake regulator
MSMLMMDRLRAYIDDNKLKNSKQREKIAEIFFSAGGHLNVEQLLDRVRQHDPHVGQATVYRTMRLLVSSGLAEARQFGDGQTRYEPHDDHDDHHDHLICTSCDSIVEFVNSEIESLQDRVAKEHGYRVTHHKMELYGLCPTCQKRAQ